MARQKDGQMARGYRHDQGMDYMRCSRVNELIELWLMDGTEGVNVSECNQKLS